MSLSRAGIGTPPRPDDMLCQTHEWYKPGEQFSAVVFGKLASEEAMMAEDAGSRVPQGPNGYAMYVRVMLAGRPSSIQRASDAEFDSALRL